MDLLPQFNPDDYPDSPGYKPLLQMHTPSKVSKCDKPKLSAYEVRPITRPIARFPIPRLRTLSSQVSDHGVELMLFVVSDYFNLLSYLKE